MMGTEKKKWFLLLISRFPTKTNNEVRLSIIRYRELSSTFVRRVGDTCSACYVVLVVVDALSAAHDLTGQGKFSLCKENVGIPSGMGAGAGAAKTAAAATERVVIFEKTPIFATRLGQVESRS
jgi:hypothetical protein